MKNNKRKITANKYFLGGFTLPSGDKLAGAITGGLNLGSSLIPSSGSGKTDAITSGVAAGLQTVGSAFGPLGGAVGAAAGMLTKGIGALVGSSDQVNESTGEYIKGKGIKGRRSRNRMRAKYLRVNQGIADANLTSDLQEDYANEYGENDYSLAAYGGTLPTTLAYLDDGELLRTPSGQITAIPEQGKPTDSNLMNVPVGTQVLSDKLKVPGTNKTFAEVGKKYMKKDNTKAKDRYAENSRMLNNRNNQRKYDKLMALQEQVKAKKDRKLKKGIPAYNTAGTILPPEDEPIVQPFWGEAPQFVLPTNQPIQPVQQPVTQQAQTIQPQVTSTAQPTTPSKGFRNVQSAPDLNWAEDMMNTKQFVATLGRITPANHQQYNDMQNMYPILGFGNTKPGDVVLTPNKQVSAYQNTFNNLTSMNDAIGALYTSGRLKGRGGSNDRPKTWQDGLAGDASWLRHLGRNVTPEQLTQINKDLTGVEAYINSENGMVNFRPYAWTSEEAVKPTRSTIPIPKADLDPQSITKTSPIPRQPNPKPRDLSGFWTGIGDALAGAANLIGPLANIRDSKPETVPVRTYTPHFGPVDYNVDPLVQQANLTNAINRYNIDKAGGAGRGANLAQAVQSGIVRNRAIADAYANKQNIENQRRFQNAGIYNDWARWDVENRHRGDVENAQNRAAARNLRRTGFSQLGTALASMNRDRRYTARDRALLNFMRPYLEYGSTQDQINKLYSQLS